MGGLLNVILNRGSFIDIIACIISSAIVVFVTLPIHEYAHGYAAYKLGDPTARYQGRLTLNPLAHLDYIGSLMILFIGFGYAKPVPVDSRYFNNPKRDMAITAFAGPLSNLVLSFISCFISNAIVFVMGLITLTELTFGIFWFLLLVFNYIGIINISLAVFNLIPIPPLDGSKILAALLPNRIYWQLMRYERYFGIIIFVLIFASSRFSNLLSGIVTSIYGVFSNFSGLIFNIF